MRVHKGPRGSTRVYEVPRGSTVKNLTEGITRLHSKIQGWTTATLLSRNQLLLDAVLTCLAHLFHLRADVSAALADGPPELRDLLLQPPDLQVVAGQLRHAFRTNSNINIRQKKLAENILPSADYVINILNGSFLVFCEQLAVRAPLVCGGVLVLRDVGL